MHMWRCGWPTMILACWTVWYAATSTAAEQPTPTLDAAPFAQVCTWDAQRMDGVRATRLQAIDADDLFLGMPLTPDASGGYAVAHTPATPACIGLRWMEARPLVSVGLELQGERPTGDAFRPRVQFWHGATLWQGQWMEQEGTLEATPTGWRFRLATPGGLFWKVRWVLATPDGTLKVGSLSAQTTSPLTNTRLLIEHDPPQAAEQLAVELYNGSLIGRPDPRRLNWDSGSPLRIEVRHVPPEATCQIKADQTLIRFRLGEAAFSVAINDVLERGPVYVPHVGLFVSVDPPAVSLEQYREAVRPRRTILDEVRALPEQTRERAMAVTHYDPRLDAGRMMLSLACDNAKFVTEHNGTILAYDDFSHDRQHGAPTCVIAPMFGKRQVLSHTQSWGMLGLNRAAHGDPAAALPLRIAEQAFSKGIGHHATGEIVILLGGQYARFEAQVGLQWQGGNTPGSVAFQVLVDGEKRFDSGIMREHNAAKPVHLDLAGADLLTLRLIDAGDGIGYDAGNWADARLLPAGETGKPVDLADLFGPPLTFDRHLHSDWLPAPVIRTRVGDVEYRQTLFVAPFGGPTTDDTVPWLAGRPLCVIELAMENLSTTAPAPANAAWSFTPGGKGIGDITLASAGARAVVSTGDRLLAVFEPAGQAAVTADTSSKHLSLSAHLAPGQTARAFIYVPGWAMPPDQQAELTGGDSLLVGFEKYWHRIMNAGMKIDLPDAWLANVIRANLAHVLIAARNEQDGRLVAPWIASDRYVTAIDSEGNSVIRGMMYFGHFDFARRASEYYFSRYRPEGFMTTGYTLMGNGWHLWSLGEYVQLAADLDWFRSVADRPAGLCRWVLDQLDKTRRAGPDGRKVPEHGLMPPGVQADWDAYAYYFYANSYFHAGLATTGQALKAVGHPDADRILAAARQLREDVRRAYRYAQALAPVVPLRNGTWVPYYPASVYTPGPIGDFFPGQDANRSWCYDVELGSHHMAALGTMDADEPDVEWMLNHMEDVHFLADGWGGYPAERNREQWFDMGGFARVQPYYARNAELLALRDDVRPFIRTYFNALASLIDGTALSIFEHFSNFCYNKTHETGYFLHQSRTMLLTERGRELWITPFAPSAWFEDGKVIQVADAPTFFGPVGYRIASQIARGFIEVTIDPPRRSAPENIVVRLRHPEGKRIQSVELAGQPRPTFDPERETVTVKPGNVILTVRVHY